MGLSTERALNNMLERSDTPATRAFVRAVLQGEALGVSIGTMMRNLATDSRKRRRTAAQERIQKAPVKMLLPLVFMIFPAVLLVLLGPAVYRTSWRCLVILKPTLKNYARTRLAIGFNQRVSFRSTWPASTTYTIGCRLLSRIVLSS